MGFGFGFGFGFGLAISFVIIIHSHPILLSASKVYIVHMDKSLKPPFFKTHVDWYSSHFQSLTSATKESILYNYDNALHGYTAVITTEQAESLRQSDDVLDVYEDTLYNLHTTRTPEFLGLNNHEHMWADLTLDELNKASQDVIIGFVDTGVWPESPSFTDHGMTKVPLRWNGTCNFPRIDPFRPKNTTFCNKKLIGAQFFNKVYKEMTGSKEKFTPRDFMGHGTHTASTAAGSKVKNASLFGYARGNARGMASEARVASYKVFGNYGCYGGDILAAMDRAIGDGVDVLSLSLGSGVRSYYRDALALGAFAAMVKGIFVSMSAGNSGPLHGSLVNGAPWIMTVGAGTIDRDFPAIATLGNGDNLTGVSFYSGKGMGNNFVELFYGGNSTQSKSCLSGSLSLYNVSGKVVLCDRGFSARVEKGAVVKKAGGVGMILANTKEEGGEELIGDSHFLPAVAVGSGAGRAIKKYVNRHRNPTVQLTFRGTKVNVKPSPVVASFSSRGPNRVTPQILKPDIIGPGVNILAGWPGALGPTEMPLDQRNTSFNILSGTSMSCPHVSGLAALVKAAHPKWSPSAIKSALMTTAYTVDSTNSRLRDVSDNTTATPWAYGAGHVNPHRAVAPGLVYDATLDDYIGFLCSINYKPKLIQYIARRPNITCSKKSLDPGQLNYPSFSVVFHKNSTVQYTRVLTNVGAPDSVYQVSIDAPLNVAVTVEPQKLVFKKKGDRQQYNITFESLKSVGAGKHSFGSINWVKPKKQVKSPIAVMWI